MKKVEFERVAIVKAIDSAPNITQAARNLGASRRTLQARMRDYAIPPGTSGRPRQLLPRGLRYVSLAGAAGVVGLVVGLVGLSVYLRRKAATTAVVGAERGAVRMTGIDLLAAR